MRLANAIGLPVTLTLAPGATAIDVTGINEQVLLVGDGGGNTITSITGAVVGDWVIIEFADSNIASISAAAAKFDDGERFIPKTGDMIYLFHDGTNLREIARTRAARAPNAITLGVAATAIDVTGIPSVDGRKSIKLTGDGGGNNVTSITGLASGMSLRIQFVDANVTIKAAVGQLAGGLDYVGAANTVIDFFWDGTTMMETARQSLAFSVTPQAPTAITLAGGATDLDVTAVPVVNGLKLVKLTGDAGGNAVATITGFGTNNRLVIITTDAKVTFAAALAKFATGDVYISQADAVLTLHYDGTTIREVSRNIPSFAPTAITLAGGATALATATAPCNRGIKEIALTGDAGGNAVTSITGMVTGEVLILRSVDAKVSFTIAAAKFDANLAYTPIAGDCIVLFHDGTNIQELSRRSASRAATVLTVLGAGATTIDVTTVPIINGRKSVSISGDGGGNNVTTITGFGANIDLRIFFTDSHVTIKAALGKLAGAADFAGTADDIMVLHNDGTTVREVSRSANA